eukprot:TRINITY_DN2909_c0_g1_i1.p1 TRINITY_DN2909_c0_g1~~TRINITY_DN2909_c0_g1_i1.p1  ORF type:complete len:837 (-),score=69.18 TRINITY_DN2909_c0_g1_i1:1056-3476(-)
MKAVLRKLWNILFISFVLVLLSSLAGMAYYDTFIDQEPNFCNMTFMDPRFIRFPLLNISRLEYKYSLYLYKEGSLLDPHFEDVQKLPKGVPVIFVPGHAGDHTQVRSLASVSARMTPNEYKKLLFRARGLSVYDDDNDVEIDWFSLNIRDELSALSGRLLYDQAEFLNDCIKYILSLYAKNLPAPRRPSTVILVGHSMGGVVSRSVFTIKNYIPKSVNAIFTIASPHRATLLSHPSVFDFYEHVNSFWRNSTLNSVSRELEDVSILSVAGGFRDTLIKSELSNMELLASTDHQLTVMATSMPDVWASLDHISSTWCNQFVVKMVRTIHSFIDPKTTQATYDLKKRMNIITKYTKSVVPDLLGWTTNSFTLPNIPLEANNIVSSSTEVNVLTINRNHKIDKSKTWSFPWKENDSADKESSFVLLTSYPKNQIELKVCGMYDGADNMCINIPKEMISNIPLEIDELGKFQYNYRISSLSILNRKNLPSSFTPTNILLSFLSSSTNDFVYCSYMDMRLPFSYVDIVPILGDDPMTIHIPSDHSPLIQIKIDNLNKFHVLKVKLKRTTCPEEKQLADSPPPVMLQYTQGMNEERYFTFGQKDNFRLRWHEITHASNSTISNVTLAFFSNPECSHEIEISMDVVASVGHLTRSFIMIFIAPVFSWSLIVFVIQSYNFHKKGVFPPAGEVQFKLLANSAGPVIVICSSISFLAIYYGYDQYFSDLIPYFVSLVNLTEHSFVNMVKPWPSVTVLFVANLLSMGILLLWVGVCSLLLYPARCLSKDKVEGNEKVIEKSGISRMYVRKLFATEKK